MSSGYRRDFFKSVKDHSQIKLTAFERYLAPWTAKVGSLPGVSRVWIVDGFAGAGTYDTGQLGSSGLAVQHAMRAHSEGRKYKVSCFFAETNGTAIARLRRLSRQNMGPEIVVCERSFWSATDDVVAHVGRDPAFVFIDPFGLKDLKFKPLVELCRRLPKVDLMVNFCSPAARRLEKERAQLVDEAVGGGWEFPTLTATFCDRLQKACGFLKPATLPVPGEFGGLKYELVMASRHRDAYKLWNDEIASNDRGVLDGDDAEERSRLLDQAKQALQDWALGKRSFNRERLQSEFCVVRCGDFHTRVLRAAEDALVKDEQWNRGPGPVATARIHVRR